jgi:K+-sensing histidine kinase KdpD
VNRLRQREGTAEEQLERLLALQDLLAQVNRRIGPALDLGEVLAAILDAMRSLVRFRGGSVCLVEDGLIRIAVAHPPASREVLAARVPVGEGLVGACVAAGEPVYAPDLDTDPRVDPELRALGSSAPMHSFLAVPLVCLGHTIGCLQVDSTEVDAFDSDDLRLLDGLATQVAGAIESARRYEHMFELERLKADFISRASNELRTPLTITSGFVATLIDQYEELSDAERRDFLDKVHLANERLWYLVNELLTITMFEAGAAHPANERVALAALCDEVREVAPRPDAVSIDCAPDLAVETDPAVVRQLLRLLVDNALSSRGGADQNPRARTGDGLDVGGARPGAGDPPQGSRPAARALRSRGHQEPGLGLGLFLVRSLAATLGGTVELDEEVAAGACFRISFPSR